MYKKQFCTTFYINKNNNLDLINLEAKTKCLISGSKFSI